LVAGVRTVGMTGAVAFDPAVLADDPGLPERVVSAAQRHGIATRVLRGHALQFSPAFTITEEEIDAIVDGFGDAIEEVAGAR